MIRSVSEQDRVTVRVAETADEVAAAGLVVERAYVVDGLAHDSYLAVLRDSASRARDAVLLVALDGRGRVVGTATFVAHGTAYAELSRGPHEAEVRMLGVAPEARGRGVGEALLRACLDLARRAGASDMVLSTQSTMAAAHRMYARLGFTRTPERDWSPVPGVELLTLRLELP